MLLIYEYIQSWRNLAVLNPRFSPTHPHWQEQEHPRTQGLGARAPELSRRAAAEFILMLFIKLE